MTLPALDQSYLARGTSGPKYRVGPRCANPDCKKWAEHAHHILRRSFLTGDYAWVDIDGWIVGNLTGLCPSCHSDVTGGIGGHKAAIRIVIEDKVFLWCLISTVGGVVHYHPTGELDPQPPTPDTAAGGALDQAPAEASESCPHCGHVRRRRSSSSGERRRRKTWLVNVPDDHEDGADVLDTLVEDLAHVLGLDPGPSARYFVLAPALAYAQMDLNRFIDTVKGVGS